MNVILAKNAGFCAGVARSVAAAEEALAKYGAVWCIGDLIHNRDEMRRLAGLGLRTVRSADEVPSGAPVLIRAHGEPPETYAVLREKGAIVLDTTCGKVEDIHRIARETAAQGGTLIVFGGPPGGAGDRRMVQPALRRELSGGTGKTAKK